MAAEPIPDETTVAPPASGVSPRRARAARWAKLLATFLTGQTLVQGLNVLTGFLLLRWMSVEAYAQYTVANSFQGTIGVLTDLGVSGSIVALVGQRIHDKRLVGEYVRAARAFRGRMFLVMALVAAVAFPLVTKNQPWAWHVKLLLLGGVLTQIFFSAWGMYNAPLLMHRRLADSYRAATVPAFLRLAVSWAFHAAGALTGWLATWINGTMTLVGGWMTRRASRDLMEEPPRADPERTREIVRYLAPLWPGMVYYAFQGQISVLLLSVFGQSRSLAELGALGRLGQLFTVFSAFLGAVLVPLVAASPRESLLRRYLVSVGGAAVVLGLLTLSAFVTPAPWLWLLGARYGSLGPILGWSILGSSLGFLGGMLYTLNNARRWVFWSATWSSIGLTLLSQVLFVVVVGITTTAQAVAFGVMNAAVGLVVPMCVAFAAYRREGSGKWAP